jgi:RNA polymerase sigma-70 factor, ECF subfamily
LLVKGAQFSIMLENYLKNTKEIFEKAKKGDREAFSEIYEVYFKPLYRYVYLRIGNKAESDDLVQDIFIKALSSNSNDSNEDSVSYNSSSVFHFYNVARKSVLDWNRKRRRIVLSDESMENYSDARVGKTDENLKKEEFNNLLKAMEELSHEQQDVIIFKFFDEFSNEDIGSFLDISARSARHLETQGLIAIRNILKQQYEQQS